MLIDKNRYKELKKEAGGIAKEECYLSLIVKERLGVEMNRSCILDIYPNGIFIKFGLNDREYIPMESLENIEYDNRVINVHVKDEGVLKIDIEKNKDIILVYNILGKHLGMEFDSLNLEGSEKVLKKIKKDEESQRRTDEFNQTMEVYNRIRRESAEMKKENDNVVKCPKCGSTSITANKRGFSLTKGAVGVVAVGALGAVAAGHGKNKVIVTCLKCGHQWKPGKK